MKMSFSQRFNQWLVERGKEPTSDELARIVGEAAKATAIFIRHHESEIIAEAQDIAARRAMGEIVDVEARVNALIELQGG